MNLYYSDYLQLETILNAQELESDKHGKRAHDEMLFIVIHQTYELWFKQILFELEEVRTSLDAHYVPENAVGKVVRHLQRVIEIEKILIDQIRIMETMTPLDFLDFRDYLVPASGFQSLQFKLLEAKMGLKNDRRLEIEKRFFTSRLKPEDVQKVLDEEKKSSLLLLLNNWLERMPFAHAGQFNYWDLYQKVVYSQMKSDEAIIRKNPHLTDDMRTLELANLKLNGENFDSLFNRQKHEELLKIGKRKLSQEAMLNALFIYLHRDEPLLQAPYQMLMSLVEIEEHLTLWRYRHAMMVQRLLGTKVGTGGSSGSDYLKASAENSRVFTDLFGVSSFLIPRSLIPELPPEIRKQLSFPTL